jgi:hypothetical protein
VSDTGELERRYRRLLAWYPRAFRRENEQEIIVVLLALAPEGQRRPRLLESADLIRSGVWMRLRPRLPSSVPTVGSAVRLMYVGAAVCVINLIISMISLAVTGPSGATLRLADRTESLPIAVTTGVAGGLVVVALWLWMARTTSRGRNWARILSTVLFGLATLELISVASEAQIALDLIFWAPTWLVSAAAIWLLWRPASGEFFEKRPPRSPPEAVVAE